DDIQIEKTKKCPICKEVFDVKDTRTKKKVKKSFTITKVYCPICKSLIDEKREDLTKVDKLVEVEEKVIKEYTNNERYAEIKRLIKECTSSNELWGKYILKSIIKAGNLELLDQALQKGTKDRTTFKKVLSYRGED
ncbi:hypothetical protein KY321_01405, partial [Candidatus Woesearchaeota archaeon]|nr:hypothetical protein [Candidatus Woesearchaeota archaeon]